MLCLKLKVVLSLLVVVWLTDESRAVTTESIIPEGYSPLTPPSTTDGPIKVDLSVVIMNVRDIIETSQEVTLEMNIRIHWFDERLQNRTGGQEIMVISPTLIEELWHPDIFIDRVKTVSTPLLISKPASLRIHSNGRLRYSVRTTAVLSCRMNFHYYPADVQHCNIDFKTYAYPMTILVLEWHEGMGASLDGHLTLANFELALESPGAFTTNSSSGTYSGIRFTISLKRRMSFHLLQTYLPTTLLIFVSWLTLIVPQDSGAIAISMTLLLTTVAMFASVRGWLINGHLNSQWEFPMQKMVCCLTMIFLSFAQHAITVRMRHMKFASKLKSKKNEKKQQLSTNIDQTDDPLDNDSSVFGVAYRLKGKESLQRGLTPVNESEYQMTDIGKRYAKDPQHFESPPQVPPPPPPVQSDSEVNTSIVEGYKLLGNQIRKVYFLSSPILFFLFNLIYWPWLMNSGEFNKSK